MERRQLNRFGYLYALPGLVAVVLVGVMLLLLWLPDLAWISIRECPLIDRRSGLSDVSLGRRTYDLHRMRYRDAGQIIVTDFVSPER